MQSHGLCRAIIAWEEGSLGFHVFRFELFRRALPGGADYPFGCFTGFGLENVDVLMIQFLVVNRFGYLLIGDFHF